MATTSYDFDVIEIHSTREKSGTYEVCDSMKDSGWVGGQWARIQNITSWRDGMSIRWRRIIEPCGDQDPMFFVLRASYEETDQNTSYYPGKTGVVTCCLYGQFLFKHYETVNKAERDNPGAGAALVYTLNSNLYVSDRGLLTSERESPGLLSRAIGMCVALPDDNIGYLGAEVLHGPS